MSSFRTKNSLSPAKQSSQRRQRGQLGAHTGVLALLSLAACAPGGDDSPTTDVTPAIGSVPLPVSDIPLDDAFLYIAPQGALDGVDLAQIDLSSLVLDGGGDTTLINLGDLDASEVSIVTNSEGNQVFAVSRAAAISRASSDTFSAPVSYNLAASRDINFVDTSGGSQTIKARSVIAEDALRADPGVIAVIKRLADVEGTSAQLAATTVDLSEVFLSTSEISFSVVDDDGNTYALSDKNRDGVSAEFSLGELAASFGESGTITVRGEVDGDIAAEQTFSVVVRQTAVNTPFVGDGSVVTITDGSANSASVVVLPLSGGDGVITYALEGENKDSGGFFILQGRLFFSADLSGTYTLVATDADGDEASITIDFTIPDDEVSVVNALAAQTHVGNVGNVTVSLAEVFDGGDGDLTLSSNDGNVAGNTLIIDTAALEDGDHTITVTAADRDGDIAIDSFVLTVDKSPTVDTAIDNTTLAGGNDGTTIDVSGVFGHPADGEELTLSASVGTIGTDGMLTLSGADLADGTNTITLTATDSDLARSESVTSTFEITTDKAPIFDAAIADIAVVGNGTHPDLIDLSNAFAGGSGELTLSVAAIQGSIDSNNMLDVSGVALADGANVIVVTATDNNGDEVTTNITINADKSPTVDAAIADIAVDGNDPHPDLIDLNGVFKNGSGNLTLSVAPAQGVVNGNGLDISGVALVNGANVIVVTATDDNGDEVTTNITINADKSPTVDAAIADIAVDGNDTHLDLIDLNGVFKNGSGNLTLSVAPAQGSINSNNMLDISSVALVNGANVIVVTAIDNNGDEVTTNITINADKSPTIVAAIPDDRRATNHSNTTIDLTTVFDGGSESLTYAVTTSNGGAGVSTANSTLTINYAMLGAGIHTVTVTATDSDAQNADSVTDEFVIEVVKLNDNSLASTVTLTGTTYADEITDNSFAEVNFNLNNVDLVGGVGDDTISRNTFTASWDVKNIILDGEAGDDTIEGNSLNAGWNATSITFDGGDGNDTIEDNTLTATWDVNSNAFDGGAGDDSIRNNNFTASWGVISTTFDGGDGNDSIEGNTITATNDVKTITLEGGAGDDTISGNSLIAGWNVNFATFDGGGGDDTISDNTVTATWQAYSTTFDGGDGDDTISGNTISARWDVYSITFDGGDGDDTISDNHFEATAKSSIYDVYSVTLMGGAGDDLFRDNTATQANGESASLTIDGGVGEDTVVFRLNADQYIGATAWVHGATITVSGDGAAVTLMDIETISFADGTAYTGADVIVAGNVGTTIDLASLFAEQVTSYTVSDGTVSNNSLTLAGSELEEGVNTIIVTATDTNGDAVTIDFTIHADKSPTIVAAISDDDMRTTNDSNTTIDLTTVFANGSDTLTYAVTTSNGGAGVSTANSTLTINYAMLGAGTHTVTVTATDRNADAITEVFVLQVRNYDSALNDNSLASTVTLTGTTLDDAITGNSFSATTLSDIDLNGGDGNDSISGNTFTSDNSLRTVSFSGGDGNDTISGNTFNAIDVLSYVTLDGGDGNDTISDNHFESTGLQHDDDVYRINLSGGAGDDLFRNNTATVANKELARLTIDGGDGEDTVVFLSVAGEYAGLSEWIHSSDGGGATLTLTGDGAAVTLIDVETIAFADGASYSVADAGVEGNGGVLYDLTNAFTDADTTFIAYETDRGTITGNTLALAGTELGHGANTIVVTATASDNTETTETITVNAAKTLKIAGLMQHNEQTLDLNAIFFDANTYTYTSNTPVGINLNGSTLTFDNSNSALTEGEHIITITATDASNVFTHILTYDLDTVKDQALEGGTTYIGTTYADAISGNSFAESGNISFVELDGGAGDDTISSNTFTTSSAMFSITFDGGAGDDTISSNTFTATYNLFYFTFDGGDGNDTISGNTLVGNSIVSVIFDGGDGNDTISDNHIDSKGTDSSHPIHAITLMGGAGDDLFRDNTATQANGASASFTVDGGDGEDTFEFRLNADQYIGAAAWLHGETITVSGDGVAATLMDIETISFADGIAYTGVDVIVTGNGGTTIDLASVFAEQVTNYTVSDGTVSNNSLILAASELEDGVNTITVTATDTNNNAVTMDFTIHADKSPTIVTAISDDIRTTNDSNTTIDLTTVFANGSETLTYAVTASNGGAGVSTANSALTINYAMLGVGTHTVTVTATDRNADAVTDEFVLQVRNYDSTLNDRTLTSNIPLTGTTLDDAITGNSFSTFTISNVDLDGGDGNDTISGNTFTASVELQNITFDGGAGDDTIMSNNLNSTYYIRTITFDGGEGDDTISDNTLTANGWLRTVTVEGGDGNDTISNNSFIGKTYSVFAISIDGGAGDDTISSNTLTSSDDIDSITFAGGDGNDNISDNHIAVDSGGSIANVTFEGGSGDDTISGNHVTVDGVGYVEDITFDGGFGDDTFSGNKGGNHYQGGSGDDAFLSNQGGTHYEGGSGNDIFHNNVLATGGGNVTITLDGGSGTDVASWAGNLADYTISTNNSTTTVIDAGVESILIGIEYIQFDDTPLLFADKGLITGSAATTTNADNVFGKSETTASATIDAGDGADYLVMNNLSGVDSVLSAGAGNDLIGWNTVNGIILGGAGTDAVTLTIDNYTFKHSTDNATTTVTDSTGNTMTLSQVENLIFDGDTFTLVAIDNLFASQPADGNGIVSDGDSDLFYGYALANGESIDAGGGNDSIVNVGVAAGGTYTFDGGAGTDLINLNLAGGNTYIETLGADTNTTLTDADSSTTIVLHDWESIYYQLPTVVDSTPSTVYGATQHSTQIIDIAAMFSGGDGMIEISTNLPNGMTFGSDNQITISTAALEDELYTITVTSTDEDEDTVTHNITYTLDTLKDRSISTGDSIIGTTLDDALSGHSLTGNHGFNILLAGEAGNDTIQNNTLSTNYSLGSITSVTFDGGAGDDIIKNNTHSVSGTSVNVRVSETTLQGGEGDDMIMSNTLSATGDLTSNSILGGKGADNIAYNMLTATGASFSDITGNTIGGGDGDDDIQHNTVSATDGNINGFKIAGGTGDDVLSNNTLSASNVYWTTISGEDGNDTISNNLLSAFNVHWASISGGNGNDTISNNTITAGYGVKTITFDGGAGDDNISDNHIESTSTDPNNNVCSVTLMGGVGDDVFRDNTATQANGDLSSITIDGGADTDDNDTDKVYFELEFNDGTNDLFTVTGAYGSNITVTDIAQRTNAGDNNDVNSYAEYVLIDIEELYFDDVKYEF